MRKRVSGVVAAILMITTILPTPSFAVVPVVPPQVAVASGGSGAGAAGGVIGLAGFLVLYDLIRRTSCSGDFFGLGDRGFSTPMLIGQNILTPAKCGPVRKRHSTVLHAKG